MSIQVGCLGQFLLIINDHSVMHQITEIKHQIIKQTTTKMSIVYLLSRENVKFTNTQVTHMTTNSIGLHVDAPCLYTLLLTCRCSSCKSTV